MSDEWQVVKLGRQARSEAELRMTNDEALMSKQ